MYKDFSEEMANQVAAFGRARMSETPVPFTDDTGVIAALERCLSETVATLATARSANDQNDLRCIYDGLDCLIGLLEEAR
ncbi:hypothetical protein BH10PSE18_BH10PSE18_23410 [soil metagenome]